MVAEMSTSHCGTSPCGSDYDAVEFRDRGFCLRRSSQSDIGLLVDYERGDKTLPYGRKVLSTDPNQDSMSANCQTDERMITARVTAWTRCHMRLTTLTMPSTFLPQGLGAGRQRLSQTAFNAGHYYCATRDRRCLSVTRP